MLLIMYGIASATHRKMRLKYHGKDFRLPVKFVDEFFMNVSTHQAVTAGWNNFMIFAVSLLFGDDFFPEEHEYSFTPADIVGC